MVAGCCSRVGEGDCDAACERMLYATRQARTMQGKEQDRIVRAWLVVGDAAPHPRCSRSTRVSSSSAFREAALARSRAAPAPIYLIDPLGNLVLRYADDPDIKGIGEGPDAPAQGVGDRLRPGDSVAAG